MASPTPPGLFLSTTARSSPFDTGICRRYREVVLDGGGEVILEHENYRERNVNCYIHPDREAVAACADCGKSICLECKVVLRESAYCNACANTMFIEATSAISPRPPNWFSRHLNWTVVLCWLGAYIIAFITGVVVGMVMFGSNPSVAQVDVERAVIVVGSVVTLAWLLPTNGWVLRRKGQSEWHLLWLLAPFGVFVIVWLQNQKAVAGQEIDSPPG
jgi:hypothetical protein